MLLLKTKSNEVMRVSKVLVKYNVKSSITNQTITLTGDISEQLITELCSIVEITSIQNYISNEPIKVTEEAQTIKQEEQTENELRKKSAETPIQLDETIVENQSEIEDKIEETLIEDNEKVDEQIDEQVDEESDVEVYSDDNSNHRNTNFQLIRKNEYNLLFKKVKRGEIYVCDFGEPYGSEQGYMRYAIVIQNDTGNNYSPCTIVIACTTRKKNNIPVHLNIKMSSENIIDYDEKRVGNKNNVVLAEYITSIDKKRLRRYIGTVTPKIMEEIDKRVMISIFSGKIEQYLETYLQEYQEQKLQEIKEQIKNRYLKNNNPENQRRDINMAQVKLLSLVDINELLSISQSDISDEEKIKNILELFGFDLNQVGVQYLQEAIISSPKDTYFNLETLSKEVSKKVYVEKEEVTRLIVARIKEKFNFKKTSTIDFIRLVNSFLI